MTGACEVTRGCDPEELQPCARCGRQACIACRSSDADHLCVDCERYLYCTLEDVKLAQAALTMIGTIKSITRRDKAGVEIYSDARAHHKIMDAQYALSSAADLLAAHYAPPCKAAPPWSCPRNCGSDQGQHTQYGGCPDLHPRGLGGT